MSFVLKTANGVLDSEDESVFAQLKTALTGSKPQLHLHLHGGLVKKNSGVATAKALSGPPPKGLGLAKPWEQAFVVWRTGAIETVLLNWRELFDNDDLYKLLLKRLIEFVSRKIGGDDPNGRGAGNTSHLSRTDITKRLAEHSPGDPFADVMQPETTPGARTVIAHQQSESDIEREFQNWLSDDNEFNKTIASISRVIDSKQPGRAAIAKRASPKERTKVEAMLDRLNDDVSEPIQAKPPIEGGRVSTIAVGIYFLKHGATVAIHVIRRLRTGRDHGLYATIVEELARELYGDRIGSAIWGLMKQDAADHFKPGCFGGQLLAAIPDGCKLVVTAHSAGSIWAAELIRAIATQKRGLKLDLILLAPAVRMDLFASAIKQGGSAIERCRVFTMRDELERADILLGKGTGYLYPSSLLYLVSGLFEKLGKEPMSDAPLLGLERFLGLPTPWLSDPDQLAAIQEITRFFQSPGRDIVYSKTADNALAGSRTRAVKHGDFDNDALTLESIATFFK